MTSPIITVEKTRFALSIGALIAGGVIIWQASRALADFRNEINANFTRLELALTTTKTDLQADINRKSADRWTGLDMKVWSYELERQNRELLRRVGPDGLVVPPVKPATTP